MLPFITPCAPHKKCIVFSYLIPISWLPCLTGKIGGAFGSHTHSGESAVMLYDTMMHVFKIDMTALGPLNLTEAMVTTPEGIKAGQDYGKAIGEQLNR